MTRLIVRSLTATAVFFLRAVFPRAAVSGAQDAFAEARSGRAGGALRTRAAFRLP
jgi:hypothetical protein